MHFRWGTGRVEPAYGCLSEDAYLLWYARDLLTSPGEGLNSLGRALVDSQSDMFEIDQKHFFLSCNLPLAKARRRMTIVILRPAVLTRVVEAHWVEARRVEAHRVEAHRVEAQRVEAVGGVGVCNDEVVGSSFV